MSCRATFACHWWKEKPDDRNLHRPHSHLAFAIVEAAGGVAALDPDGLRKWGEERRAVLG